MKTLTKEKNQPLQKDRFVLPEHIAIIMDGNRRWAKERGKNSKHGHLEGYRRITEISEYCKKIGINILTVYALSSENLKSRKEEELKSLFEIMRLGIKKESARLKKRGIRMHFIGRREGLPKNLIKDMEKLEEETKGNKGGVFNIALNYGGRAEIVDALKNIIKKNIKLEDLTEDTISQNLYTSLYKEPELIIRTGGSSRLSNFLIWQAAYSELYFTNTLWPNFTTEELNKSFDFYSETQRNFGH